MNKLVALARTKIGCGYVWGSQGEILTKELLDKFKDTFGASHYDFTSGGVAVSASKWIGKQVFDCSGLVLWCLRQLGFLSTKEDYNASGFFYQFCTSIDKSKLQPGDLVFVDAANDSNYEHIGIYAGSGKVIHARGTRYGVEEGSLDTFTDFGRLKFNIGEDNVVEEVPIGAATVHVSDVLNVRSGPGSNFTDVGDVYDGNVLPVYEQKNGWLRVGLSKWISGSFAKFTESKSKEQEVVDAMMQDGLITDNDYWLKVLKGEIPANPEYLQIAFRRATDKIS